ncbi:MAG: hypothetical protein AABZ78_10705 [Chloroflexota bacterium]
MTQPTHGDAASAVADALQTYPLVHAPPTLRPNAMRRITQLARPRFSLTWFDYALGLFGSGMAATPWFVWHLITPQMLFRLQVEFYIIAQRLNPSFLLPMWLGG